MDELSQHVQELFAKLLHSPGWKVAGAFCLALFGAYRPAILGIVIAFCADWGLGLIYAVLTKSVSSEKSLRGVIKALIYSGIILAGAQLSKATIPWLGIGAASLLDSLVLLTEVVSVMEKLEQLAVFFKVDIPWLHGLVRYLQQARDRNVEETIREKVG
jgi:phage-related holin